MGSYLVFLEALWERALPAAVFDALEVLPSRSTLEAALAALLEVCLEFLNKYHLPILDFFNCTIYCRLLQERKTKQQYIVVDGNGEVVEGITITEFRNFNVKY